MDKTCKIILNILGIQFIENNNITQIEEMILPREQLISQIKYEEVKKYIPELKKIFSSSFMTSLHENAKDSQKWPLLNLVRQILCIYNYRLEPIRKCDGYTSEGIKKYKRFFKIIKSSKM